MVECESIPQDNSCHIFPVLIDTWWNVNTLIQYDKQSL
mgnify:CR=1 FL=1